MAIMTVVTVVAWGGYADVVSVRDRVRTLALRWCDALIERQIACPADRRIDGAIACPACGLCHGRIADLVYPFAYFHVTTGKAKYLEAARRAVNWSERMMVRQDGGLYNDYKSTWWAITAFAQIAIGQTLQQFGDRLPADFRLQLGETFRRESEFLDQKVDAKFLEKVNVNYPSAMCEAMFLAYELLGEEKWRLRAKEICDRVQGAFLADGLLRGEGHPIEQLSARGRSFVDLGYNLEESLPSLYEYARAAKDLRLEAKVRRSFLTHLEFLLPDGAIDNSCGSRAEKWTYYGSRTSDGMLAFLCQMALRGEPGAWTAAERHLSLLERCTGTDGLLAGGPAYESAGEPACVHHAFAHVKSLVRFLTLEGLDSMPEAARDILPREKEYGVKVFDSMGVSLVSAGPWRATFSTTDAFMNIRHGRLYVSGGSPAVLWHRKLGPIVVGTMPFYKMTEAHNMQDLRRERTVLSMTPRLEVEGYMSVADGAADFAADFTNGVFTAAARGRLTDIDGRQSSAYAFNYAIDENGFVMRAKGDGESTFVFPIVVSGQDKVVYSGRSLCVTKLDGGELSLVADRELRPLVTDRGATAFSPVGGFLYSCASAKLSAGDEITVKLTCR